MLSCVQLSTTRCVPLLAALCAIGSTVIATAHAAETVTLRSGFTVICAARQPAADGTVRLYLQGSAAPATDVPAAAGNYIDVPASSIAAVEPVPDPPPASSRAATRPAQAGLQTLLQHSGEAHNVNVALLASVVKAESNGNAHAVSRAGARGLMQLMPGTASAYHVADSFAPEQNLDGGSAYLDFLLTRYRDNIPLAVAAYNAGPRAVDRYHGIPPFRETRVYVSRVLREFNRLALAESHAALPAMAAVPRGPGL